MVTDRDGERPQPGLEQTVGDDVAVGADLAGVLVVGAGTVGEQDTAERRPGRRQALADLHGDREVARLRRVGGRQRDHFVAVEHADRDVLAELLADRVERGLGAGGETLAAEVAGAEPQHARRDFELAVDVAHVPQPAQRLQHAVGRRAGESGGLGDVGRRTRRVLLVEGLEDRERTLDRLHGCPHERRQRITDRPPRSDRGHSRLAAHDSNGIPAYCSLIAACALSEWWR